MAVERKKERESANADGGLAPVSAQRDTPLSPPSTSAEIFWHTCLHSNLQTIPPNPKNAYAKFQNPKTTFGNYPPLLYHSAPKTYAKFQNPKINFGDYHPPTMA